MEDAELTGDMHPSALSEALLLVLMRQNLGLAGSNPAPHICSTANIS